MSNAADQPATPLRQSPLVALGEPAPEPDAGCLIAVQPLFEKSGGASGPLVRIEDLSARGRVGFKGRGAGDWLGSLEYPVPAANLEARVTGEIVIARLADDEYLLLAASRRTDQTIARFGARFDAARSGLPSTVVRLPRQSSHACLAVTGTHVTQLFARCCGVDLSSTAFSPGAVRQTLVAGCAVILVRIDDAVLLLVDSTVAEYLTATLIAIGEEL